MHLSLRARIVMVAACGTVIFALLFVAVTRRSMREREQQAEARATALSRMLAQAPAAVVSGRPAEGLDRLLALFGARDPDLMFVVFTDASGRVETRWARPEREGGPRISGELGYLADADYKGRPDWKLVDVTLQNREGKAEQHLRVGYSLAAARQAAARHAAINSFWFVLLAGGFLAVAWWAAGKIVEPLALIVSGVPRAELGETLETPAGGSREIAAIVHAVNALAAEMRARVRLHSNFARFVSEPVARKVISDDLTVRLGGERREVSVLFADIRGFTSFAATMAPERVVRTLNDYFQTLADVIPRYGGTLDKFLGDGLMAVFNAATVDEDHEISAVMAGIAMARVMGEINDRRRAAGERALLLGIGINTGEVVAGTFGSESRLEYTVIGAAVNLAQRIQSQARQGEILLGERTYQAVRQLVDAVALEPVLLRGIPEPVRIYQVRELRGATPPGQPARQTDAAKG